MEMIDKIINDYINKNFSEIKENLDRREEELNQRIKETEDKLTKRLNKSREYRIMLRDYQKELKEREDALIEREEQVVKLEKTVTERVLASVVSKKKDIEKEIESLSAQATALRSSEITLIDWISRMQKKEQALFDDIAKDVDKWKECKNLFDDSFDGYKFEEYTATVLREAGYENVEVTQKSNDYGADVVAEKDGVIYVFQCKFYSNMVGIEAVQQIYSAKIHYGAHIAVVVTNSVFTKAAKILADELKVILWDGKLLLQLAGYKSFEDDKIKNPRPGVGDPGEE